MNCASKDCPNAAVCALMLNVPAQGMPIPEHDPLQMLVGAGLCEDHFARQTPQDWLEQPDYRRIFEAAARGKAPPDFARAFITRVEFDSPVWQALLKARKPNS